MIERIPPILRPEHPVARPLSALVSEFGLHHIGSLDGVEITGVTLRSTEVRPGDLYVGIKGAKLHGANFTADAKTAGAVAILTDPEGAEIAAQSGLPIVVVDSPRSALAEVSAWVYQTNDHPPLLLGVTGSNGKTSVTYLLEAILKQLGLVTGLSSTAERHIGELTIVSRLTTPEASELHALLARMRESEVRAVAVEVSVQAISKHRIDGIVFDVVAFTNLSHDHFDEFSGMEEYFQCKLGFFAPEHGKRSVVSLDSPWGQRVVEGSRIPVTTVSAVPGVDAEWNVEVLDEQVAYTEFRLTGPEGRSLVTRIPLIGWHMAANAGLAIVMLVEAGFELEAIGQAIAGGIEVYLPGRTELLTEGSGPSIYVDFGHSEDAFLTTIAAVRKVTKGKMILVVGADGDRDTTKRQDMGRVASEGSDILVITDHHPRFEDPAVIREALLEGARLAENPAELYEVGSPEAAIRHALTFAVEGDAILWEGPGPQDYREIQGVRTPYSAREEARAALREAGWV